MKTTAILILYAILAAGQPSSVRKPPLVGDGKTDNTVILNGALVVPVVIFPPCGVYVFSSIVVKSDDVSIIGRGTCTIFRALGDSAALFDAQGHANVKIQNLVFDLTTAPASTLAAGSATFTDVTITPAPK